MYHAVLAAQQDRLDLYVQELPFALEDQVVHRVQGFQPHLLDQEVHPSRQHPSHQEIPLDLFSLHFPSYLVDPAFLLLHLFQIAHFYQLVQAFLGSLWVLKVLAYPYLQQVQLDQVILHFLEFHLFLDLLLLLEALEHLMDLLHPVPL